MSIDAWRMSGARRPPQADQNDPFKVRSTTHKKASKPWDIDDAFKGRGGGTPGKLKGNAWDVADAFKSRDSYTTAQQSGTPHRMAAGGAARTIANADPRVRNGRDANASSLVGGIFG